MVSLISVVCEIWKNRYRMLRVVWYDIKIENRSLYLGTLWKVLVPFIQIGTFWLVFGMGIRGGAPVDGFPFFVWLLAGLVPWFFINRGITSGSTSINNKAGLIFKIKYPIATVPVGTIIHCLYDHAILLVILIALYIVNGLYPTLYWLNLIYYILFTFAFLVSISMVLSVVVRLTPDVGRLIASLMQLLFFLTPIIWQDIYMPDWLLRIFALNPVRYVVMGFRNSLLFQQNFFEYPIRALLFWLATFVIFVFGCWLQKKFSHRFVDWT